MAAKQQLMFFVFLALAPGVFAKQTVGYIESVKIYPGALEIKAKVDSGATNSSLNCACTKFFAKNGQQWVRFSIRNFRDESIVLEKQIVRYTGIKRHFGDVQKRPVINLGICMGGVYREVEVNLVDRTGYDYQMLIGRSFMLNDFLISPGEENLTRPGCPKPD